jgi:hypothetical protein
VDGEHAVSPAPRARARRLIDALRCARAYACEHTL